MRRDQILPFIAIALASLAVIVVEIAATRILSVVLWYHWAFLSVSLAMLGLGAPGVWFALRPPGPRMLARLLALSAFAIPLSMVAILRWAHWFGAYKVLFCMLCLIRGSCFRSFSRGYILDWRNVFFYFFRDWF